MIAENVNAVKAAIARAEREAGRPQGSVKLIGVTKFVDTGRIGDAVDAGITAVGENRVQECVQKLPFFEERGVEIHLIGQLQTNKVKYIIGKVALIQSVDRPKLAAEISRAAAAENTVQDVLIEVNIGGECQKGGVAVTELGELFDMIAGLSSIRVKGLMCVPPVVGEDEARVYFSKMRKIFESYAGMKCANIRLEELSMGMSGDYIAAIKEGATMVRVGTAIFGPRDLRAD